MSEAPDPSDADAGTPGKVTPPPPPADAGASGAGSTADTGSSGAGDNDGESKGVDVETMVEGRFLAMRKRGTWEYAERVGSKGVVAVVAITDDQQMILVEQDRPAVQARVIELPAGLAGDLPYQEDEPLATAAGRELFEETGYRAKDIRQIVAGPTSAGVTNEVVTFFHARGLTKMGEGGGTRHENIRVHYVPVREVRDWCAEQIAAGKLVDFKVYAALYLVSADAAKVGPKLWY